MSGFRKAKAAQAAIKMSGYGPPGSGKTFSALLFAEGIAKATSKRIAYIDTERGTDFYAMDVADRKPHPEAFDFDAIYTRSLVEVLREIKALDQNIYSVVVIDSVSHLWDTAINSYTGAKTKAGTIPMWAWAKIKAPYKEIMKLLIDGPFHVFILGRQANAFEEDPDTGDTRHAGTKMRAEGETAYEPHVCLHFAPQKNRKTNEQIIQAIAEKDRSGILAGKVFQWPSFDTVIKPLLGIMGNVQGTTPSDEDAAAHDAETRQNEERAKLQRSVELSQQYMARFSLAANLAELEVLGKELTPAVKKQFTQESLTAVRLAYLQRQDQLKGQANGNGYPARQGDSESQHSSVDPTYGPDPVDVPA